MQDKLREKFANLVDEDVTIDKCTLSSKDSTVTFERTSLNLTLLAFVHYTACSVADTRVQGQPSFAQCN